MYRQHRAQLLEQLAGIPAAAVIPTATSKIRNNDCEYRFRPDSDFWYLTGFAEPESVLVLLPSGVESDEEGSAELCSVLFLRERDPERETWTGRRLGIERAPEALGVDEARPISELWSALPDLLKGYGKVLYRTGNDPDNDRKMLETINGLRTRARGSVMPPTELIDPLRVLHELRLKKTSGELELMKKAAKITKEAHLAAMRTAEPGRTENEIAALIEYTFRRRGGSGAAYETIVAGGENACILHYIENDQPLKDGDLLLIDAGAEFDCYACDVTRTFPVNGRFSLEQRAIYDLVLEAEETAIEKVAPGVAFDEIHETALRVLVRGLLRLGLLEGEEDEVIESESYKPLYMHKTSHWLGLDVHDCGVQHVDGSSRPLEPGMIFTIEPGLYIAPDNESVDPRWRGIGVRIEDNVLVTESGCEVMTAGIPKTVEEVEAACEGRDLEPVA